MELRHHVLWMGEWTGVRPPWDGQLRNAPPLALLACWPLHGRTADLLRAVHVQASYLQPLTARNRQIRAAEQLECRHWLPALMSANRFEECFAIGSLRRSLGQGRSARLHERVLRAKPVHGVSGVVVLNSGEASVIHGKTILAP